MNFILNHTESAKSAVGYKSSIKICPPKEVRVEKTSRKGTVSNVNNDSAFDALIKVSSTTPTQYKPNKIATPSTMPSSPVNHQMADNQQQPAEEKTSCQQHQAGLAVQKKDDLFEHPRAECHDRVEAQKQLQSQWQLSKMAVYADPKPKRRHTEKKNYNNIDYSDITQVCRKKIVSDNDKDYSDVSKVQRRVIVNDYDKNFTDVTHIKKRDIKQREHIEIEGAKPRKINYNKPIPEITVLVGSDADGPQLMKKCLKTQRFIHVVKQ